MARLIHDPTATRIAAGPTLGGRSTVWLLPGHLLVVEQTPSHEDYRRFDLDHIQTLTLHQTPVGHWIGAMLLAGCLLFAVGAGIGVVTRWPPGLSILASLVAVAFAAGYGMHRRLGPTARLTIQTAVQHYDVPGVNRWRTGLGVLATVRHAALAEPRLTPGPPESASHP